MGRQKQQTMTLDTKLFLVPPSTGLRRGTYVTSVHILGRDAPNTERTENLAGGDMELQLRGAHIGD
jgi:hypothetical protein